MQNDGFDLGAQRREINQNDIPKIVKAISEYKLKMLDNTDIELSAEEKQFCTIVNKKKIEEQDYILVGERYKEAVVINSDYPMVELGELLSYEQPTKYIVNSVDYDNSYETPVLTAGQSFILGYTNETEGIFSTPLPVIIFDDFTTSTQFVNFPFKVKSSAMKILKNDPTITNITYLYHALKQIKFDSSIHKRYWIAEFSKKKIPLPPLSVQEEIVAEIEGYQKIIDGAKQIVDNYKPTIKIDPSWDMVKVDNVVEFISGVTLSVGECENPHGVPLITIADVSEDGYLKLDNIRKVKTNKKVNILEPGDLLFNWRNGSKNLVGKTALFNLEGDYIFASFLLGIRPDRIKIMSEFLWILLNQYRVEEKYMQFMRQNVNGLFNREELKEVFIPLPPLETQQQIVAKINEEMAIVEQNKRLIAIFEQKVADKIAEVWGE